jgi:hypothetical protein
MRIVSGSFDTFSAGVFGRRWDPWRLPIYCKVARYAQISCLTAMVRSAHEKAEIL